MAINKTLRRAGNTLSVIRIGKTSNDKISDGAKPILQTYHFSRLQYEAIRTGTATWKTLQARDLTAANCMDCNLRGNGCYVGKYMQASGLVSMLRSIVRLYPTWESLPVDFNMAWIDGALPKVEYCRFGSYGEPVLLPFPLVAYIVERVKSYTGYTHAWKNPLYGSYKKYFMASTDDMTVGVASRSGWREFYATSYPIRPDSLISCPASKEMGYRSNCAKCGLCGGLSGRLADLRSVKIRIH